MPTVLPVLAHPALLAIATAIHITPHQITTTLRRPQIHIRRSTSQSLRYGTHDNSATIHANETYGDSDGDAEEINTTLSDATVDADGKFGSQVSNTPQCEDPEQ